MGRRYSSERKQRHAADIARRLVSLSTIEGVPWLAQGQLWLLGPIASQPPDPLALARELLKAQLSERSRFGRLLGIRWQVPLDGRALAGWARDVAELRSRRDVEALVAEGVRPLRRYRGINLRDRIDRAGRMLQRLGLLVQAAAAAAYCQASEADAEVPAALLVRALPVRLYALGEWLLDPVEELRAAEVPADVSLQQMLKQTTDLGLARLAALLLGGRRRHLGGGPSGAEVPPHLAPAFQAGLAGCPAPCLWTLLDEQAEKESSYLALASLPDLGPTRKAAERLALLYGAAAARTALDSLTRPLEALCRLQARLRRLEELVQAHEQGWTPQPRAAEESEILGALHNLSIPGIAVPTLVEVFLFMAGATKGGQRLLSRRRLRRLAEEALPYGGRAAVRAMAEVWLAAAWRGTPYAERISAAARRDRLALTLAFPEAALTIPAEADAALLAALRKELTNLDGERVRRVLPSLLSAQGCDWFRHHPLAQLRPLLQGEIPADLLRRAMQHDVVGLASELDDDTAALARYLDCLDAVGEHTIPNLDLRAPWFARLFLVCRSWASTVVLTLLGQARQRRAGAVDPAELFALAAALNGSGPLALAGQGLATRLEEWATPIVQQPPPDLEALTALLDVQRQTLEEYLHHRRLAGHGETFAGALREPLRLAEQELREAAYLHSRLHSDADAKNRPYLAARLERLTDEAQRAGRCQAAVRRARKRLKRSLDQLRAESLERLLDDACRDYLRDFLGQAVPCRPLPAGLRSALQLLAAGNIDHDLLASFLRDVLRGQPPPQRPANRDWLARAEAAGIRVREWLEGFRQTVKIAGETITFASERDPLIVLKMGSYFETCLSLEGGCNAASTLVNALDVNKQVIYGRRADGAIVARKLIGANLRGELAGYRTYAIQHETDIRRALGEILRQFAARCHLRLSDTATPEILHPGFWYDDSNEPWESCPAMPAAWEPAPVDVPNDAAAVSEWNLRTALVAGDALRLQAVAVCGSSPWREAALYHLLRLDAGAANDLRGSLAEVNGDRVMEWLTYAGQFMAARSLARLPECFGVWRQPTLPCDCLPCHRDVLARGLRTVAEIARSLSASSVWRGNLFPFWLPGYAALVTVEQLLDTLRAIAHLTEPIDEEDSLDHWISDAASMLQTAWLRDGNSAELARALSEDSRLVQRVIVALARRERIPRLAPGLRRLLEEDGIDEEEAGLALGTQEEPHDGSRLLARLRERPESIKLAVAVVRTGHPEAAEEARDCWRVPRNLDAVLQDNDWWNLAREVGSRRLAHVLTRSFRRHAFLAATSDSPNLGSALLERLALLGLPGPGGDAGALVRSLADTEPYRRIAGHLQDMLPNLATLGSIGAIEVMADRLDRGGAGAVEVLNGWLRMRSRQGADRLRSERFERGIRRLAVSGTSHERSTALETWLEQMPTPARPALISHWLALFGSSFAQLPEELRLRCAQACWIDAAHLSTAAMETLLTCLESLPYPRQRQVLAADPSRFSCLSMEVPVWLLRLESPDSHSAQTIEMFLREWAALNPSDVLLDALQACLLWLRPKLAEPLIARVLAAIDVRQLKDKDLLKWKWAGASDSASYRLEQALFQELLPRLGEPRRNEFLRALAEKLRPAGDGARQRLAAAGFVPSPGVN